MARGHGRHSGRVGSRPHALSGHPQPRTQGPRITRQPGPSADQPGAASVLPRPTHGAEGMQMRFARIPGITPKGILDEPLWVPAPLNDFVYTEDALFNDYDTVRGGQFAQRAGGPPAAHRLRTASQDMLTLEWDAPWLTNHGVDPDGFRESLQRVLRSKRAVELLVTRSLVKGYPAELRMPITLRKLQVKVTPGEPDTRYITIDYEEDRDPHAGRRTDHARAPGKHLPTKHRLTATDTLYSLAMKYYGTYRFWRDIASANHIHGWGGKTPLVQRKGYKVGTAITIPLPASSTPVALSYGSGPQPRSHG